MFWLFMGISSGFGAELRRRVSRPFRKPIPEALPEPIAGLKRDLI